MAPTTGVLDFVPLWVAFPLLVGFVALALEGGFRIGSRRRVAGCDEREGTIGAVATATIGLLGFMLAFTFGIAVSRFESRLQLVIEDANAIGTAFLRTDLLSASRGDEARSLLRQYAEIRTEGVSGGNIADAMRRSEAIQARLWKGAADAAASDPDAITPGLYLQAVNALIDVHTKRAFVGLHMRIPTVVWFVLFGLTGVGMFSVGYYLGVSERSRSLLVITLSLAFAAVIYLVADLDRPQEGALRTNQWAMQALRESIAEPAPRTGAAVGGRSPGDARADP